MKEITKIFKDLKEEYPKIADGELLNAAIQLQRNEILKQGLVIAKDSLSGLETIATQLGYTKDGSENITTSLRNIGDSLSYIGNSIEAG